MSDRVQGVKAHDTGRDLSPLLNEHARDPVLLTALAIAESGLREHAARRGAGCDVSYGLVQQSICYPPKGIPGFTYPAPGQRAQDTPENRAALSGWAWDAANVLADAGPRLDGLYDAAAAVLGADDPRVPLAALCLWNAPNLGGFTTQQAVIRWMSDELPRLDPKHAANRENYRRALAAAEHYREQEEPPMADTYVIGPGVKQAMQANGDEPRSDEEYHGGTSGGGAQYSVTQGRDAVYRWTPQDGVKTVPFA